MLDERPPLTHTNFKRAIILPVVEGVKTRGIVSRRMTCERKDVHGE